MAGVGGEAAPMSDSKDEEPITVTIVHKVKSKLGYTEIHAPAPPMDENGEVQCYKNK